MSQANSFQWKDPKNITVIGLAVLAVDVVWASLGLLIQLVWGSRADFKGVPPEDLTPLQFLAAAHASFGLVCLLGGVVMVFWILRLSRNAHVLKGRSLTNAPIFAALWWYVIPFMSLFKPLESLSEIWDASAIDATRRKHNREVLAVWWGALIVGGLLAYLSRILPHVGVLTDIKWTAAILQSVAFGYAMKRISDMQLEKHPVVEFSDAEPATSVLSRVAG